MLSRLPRGRIWLAIAAVILVTLSLVPPAGSYARRYVFAESLQFVLFATAVPALLVLGAPWRLLVHLVRDPDAVQRRGQGETGDARPEHGYPHIVAAQAFPPQ